jgi:BolA family transcriptional regulator, general stress-responsive regulator
MSEQNAALSPIADAIRTKLTHAFKPLRLELIDQSALHQGHAGHDGRGESHFKLTLQSAQFDGLSRLQRQRAVYDVLKGEMKDWVHALSMRLLASNGE